MLLRQSVDTAVLMLQLAKKISLIASISFEKVGAGSADIHWLVKYRQSLQRRKFPTDSFAGLMEYCYLLYICDKGKKKKKKNKKKKKKKKFVIDAMTSVGTTRPWHSHHHLAIITKRQMSLLFSSRC